MNITLLQKYFGQSSYLYKYKNMKKVRNTMMFLVFFCWYIHYSLVNMISTIMNMAVCIL